MRRRLRLVGELPAGRLLFHLVLAERLLELVEEMRAPHLPVDDAEPAPSISDEETLRVFGLERPLLEGAVGERHQLVEAPFGRRVAVDVPEAEPEGAIRITRREAHEEEVPSPFDPNGDARGARGDHDLFDALAAADGDRIPG